MSKCILITGISGSGKTWIANKFLKAGYSAFSTDGVYSLISDYGNFKYIAPSDFKAWKIIIAINNLNLYNLKKNAYREYIDSCNTDIFVINGWNLCLRSDRHILYDYCRNTEFIPILLEPSLLRWRNQISKTYNIDSNKAKKKFTKERYEESKLFVREHYIKHPKILKTHQDINIFLKDYI